MSPCDLTRVVITAAVETTANSKVSACVYRMVAMVNPIDRLVGWPDGIDTSKSSSGSSSRACGPVEVVVIDRLEKPTLD